MNTPFLLIAVGYLFVAVNFAINGAGLLLPTCFGYGLIAASCWALRDDERTYRYLVPIGVILAIATVPDLLQGVLAESLETYYAVVFWPTMVLEIILLIGLAAVLARIGTRCDNRRLPRLALWLVPVVIITQVVWWAMPINTHGLLAASHIIYVIPCYYAAGLHFTAARSDLTVPRPPRVDREE